MNGIKNYLVKHGEGELEDLIDRERNMVGHIYTPVNIGTCSSNKTLCVQVYRGKCSHIFRTLLPSVWVSLKLPNLGMVKQLQTSQLLI